jgi:hypothetical protein
MRHRLKSHCSNVIASGVMLLQEPVVTIALGGHACLDRSQPWRDAVAAGGERGRDGCAQAKRPYW